MNRDALGRLTQVDLRAVWASEARDFTPWLASPENIALLAKTLDMDLEVHQQEVAVGPFRADILCKNIADDSWVVVENQIERTDHSHLGQILTYAAGLDAVTVVWIASSFTEEHRAAIDWLNRISSGDKRVHFFGVEVELWRIGDSQPAPKFNVIAKPNDWSELVRETASDGLSETEALMHAYWTSSNSYLEDRKARFRPPTPTKAARVSWGLGRTGFVLQNTISATYKMAWVSMVLSGDSAKAHFHLLHRQREEIERECGVQFKWSEQPTNKNSLVSVELKADLKDETEWPRVHEWTLRHLEVMDDAFRSRIAMLNAADWQPQSEQAEQGNP